MPDRKLKKLPGGGWLWDCKWKAVGRQFHRRIRGTVSQKDREKARVTEEAEARIDDRLTWSSAFERYRRGKLDDEDKSEHSMEDVRYTIRYLRQRLGDGAAIPGTSLRDAADFLEWRREVGDSPATVNKHRRNMIAVARWCRARGLIVGIPFEHVPGPALRKKVRDPKALPLDRVTEYIGALPRWVRAPVLFAISANVRNSAVCGVLDSDIDRETVTVLEKRSKTRHLVRDPVIDRALDLAAGWKEECGSSDPHVFLSGAGKPYKRRNLLQSAQHYWDKAGLPWATIHDLRHTMGTAAGNAGFGVDAIRALMGHDDRGTSQQYVHPDEATAARVRAALYPALLPGLADAPDGGESGGEKLYPACTPGIVPFSVPLNGISGHNGSRSATSRQPVTCPCCGHKFGIDSDMPQIQRENEA